MWDTVRDLRSEAVRTRGYLYGETWRSIDDPRIVVVVSVWGSREHWESWVNDGFRQKVNERIDRMLIKPSIARLFEEITALPTVEPQEARGGGRRRASSKKV